MEYAGTEANGKYADVIVDISHENLDKTYQYRIPETLMGQIGPGTPVRIPFGGGNRKIKGYVVGLSDKPKIEESRIKELEAAVDGGITIETRMIALAAWMREQFGGTMNDALHTVLSVKRSVRPVEKKEICLAVEIPVAEALLAEAEKKHHVARMRLLSELLAAGRLPKEIVTGKLAIPAATLKKLEEEHIISTEVEQQFRNPVLQMLGIGKPVKSDAFKPGGTEPGMAKPVEAEPERSGFPLKSEPVVLNQEQQAAYDRVMTDYRAGVRGVYLLYGVTGSGKTEVYIRIIKEAVHLGRQAILLIPEIALTYQTVRRFTECFGERVTFLHSRLSAGERYDQYRRAKEGSIDIMIGPRSALFAPMERLGLIVIDEEHETSYKSEQSPKYHARETAVELARMTGSSVILGSATPSLEAYSRALAGEYTLLRLSARAKNAVLPKIHIVNLKAELAAKNRSMFSRLLAAGIEERLNRREQVMLFLNRRGYSGFVSCRSCGTPMSCPHCSVSLTAHNDGTLRCHYCGYSVPMPKTCPVCASPYIAAFGTGTQKVEEMVKRRFPQARVLRMDADTTREKESYEKILSEFSNEEADILIGTQMIVKGHDFPKVTLVGILAADLSLNVSDYRSAERTFELLAQAAGRAGRAERPGEVVIQTYRPEHYSIVTAAAGDYEEFYRQEIARRDLLGYPPGAHIMALLCAGKDEEAAKTACEELADAAKRQFAAWGLRRPAGEESLQNQGIRESLQNKESWESLQNQGKQRSRGNKGSFHSGNQEITVIGPAAAGLSKANDYYRNLIYFKSASYEALTGLAKFLQEWWETNYKNKKLLFSLDFDPMSSY